MPAVQPPVANAGTSEDAKQMTAELCDWAFISTPSVAALGAITEDIRDRAARNNRTVRGNFPVSVVGGQPQRSRKAAIIEAKDGVATITGYTT